MNEFLVRIDSHFRGNKLLCGIEYIDVCLYRSDCLVVNLVEFDAH